MSDWSPRQEGRHENDHGLNVAVEEKAYYDVPPYFPCTWIKASSMQLF